jgi:fatty acid desaturase
MTHLITIGLFLSRVRSYLEHGVLEPGTENEPIARTHVSNVIERNVLAGVMFNYHNEHHRWPQVPSVHLPRLHRELTAGKLPAHDYSPSYATSIAKLVRLSWAATVQRARRALGSLRTAVMP